MPLRILDLFCGAGGAAMGLHRACEAKSVPHEIIGVDINNQPRYPFRFRQANALAYPLDGFDFIWASPPCQCYSSMKALSKRWVVTHPDLVAPVRERIKSVSHVIENVRHAPLGVAIELCGLSFGLATYRHRYFECSFGILAPPHLKHDPEAIRKRLIFSCVGHPGGRSARDNLHFGNTDDWKAAMGIDWMIGKEMSQAIPPAYSEYIMRQWLDQQEPRA